MFDRRAHIKGKKKTSKKLCQLERDFYRNHFLYSGFHIIDKLLGTAQSHCKGTTQCKKSSIPSLSNAISLWFV